MNETPTLEEAMVQLEAIVTRIESGELALEEMLSLYEEGQRLAALCEQHLEQAHLRLERLQSHDDGTYTTIPLDTPES